MEKLIDKYWWQGQRRKRGMYWVSWGKLTQTKQNGGLEFRDLQCFNLAMLANLSWRLIHNPEILLSNVLKGKHYPGSSFLAGKIGRRSSWGWKRILQGRQIIERGLRWRVGNGRQIRTCGPLDPISQHCQV